MTTLPRRFHTGSTAPVTMVSWLYCTPTKQLRPARRVGQPAPCQQLPCSPKKCRQNLGTEGYCLARHLTHL
jgi:hypothetical protein